MYRIINSKGETVAIATRKQDAEAIANNKLDGIEYKINVDSSTD